MNLMTNWTWGEGQRGGMVLQSLVQTFGWVLVSCAELEVEEGGMNMGKDMESNLGPRGLR